MYLTGIDGSDTPAQAQAIIAKAVQMLQSVPTAYARIDVSPLAPTNSANNGTLILQVLAYAAQTLPAEDRRFLVQDVASTGLFDMALKIVARGNQAQDAIIKSISGGVTLGDTVALALFGVPAAIDAGSALVNCVANIACRAYLYIEGTAAAEALANPGSVPTISGLWAAAGKTSSALPVAENLAKEFYALELRTSTVAGGSSHAGAEEAIAFLKQQPGVVEVGPYPLVQSGKETCGAACAAKIGQSLGLDVTEQQFIEAGVSTRSAPDRVVEAFRSVTGLEAKGGDIEAFYVPHLSDEQTLRFVNGLSNSGQTPFMALLGKGDGAHWVVINGTTDSGLITILDPVGVRLNVEPFFFREIVPANTFLFPVIQK